MGALVWRLLWDNKRPGSEVELATQEVAHFWAMHFDQQVQVNSVSCPLGKLSACYRAD